MSDLKTLFGQNVANRRRELGLSQEALAEATGVTVETISHIERGIHGPRFGLIEKLELVMDMNAESLFKK
ncbi:helix-turn-helix domain-containing protein [Gilvimarinus japonicus]|uniref:Helix-turn-helix domain-containing protein n=1 Tax=Gilvimarinus japonicus TaxID=1796469 RepID=A0ABV7HRU9_9GAMM